MLCRMALPLSGKVVVKHLASNIARAYLCGQSGTVARFISRLACHWLNLAYKHEITPISAYIPLHPCSESHISIVGKVGSRVASSGSHSWKFGLNWRWAGWHPYVLINGATPCGICYLWEPCGWTLWKGGWKCSDHPWKYQVSYIFPPSPLILLVLSKYLAKHVIGQFRILIVIASCWIKDCWLPSVLSMLEDVQHWCPIMINFVMDVLLGWVLKFLPLLYLTIWLLRDAGCSDNGSPQSARHWWWMTSAFIRKVYQHC